MTSITPDEAEAETAPPASMADGRRILLASVAAAGSSFAITLLAARVLDPATNREFIVFWAVLFGAFGVLSGIQHESTRAVAASARATAIGDAPAPRSSHLILTALPLGAAAGLAIALSAPLWAPHRLPTGTAWTIAIIAAACVAYAGHVALAGGSAGSGRWRLYADLMGGEALVRLALVGAAALVLAAHPPLLLLEAATAGAVLTWLAFLAVSPAARRAAAAKVRYSPAALTARRLSAMLTAACTAVLITMYPVFIDTAAAGTDAATVASTQIALQLTRAPIMIPLQALQGVAIAAFVARQDRPLRALASPLAKLGLLSAAGAVAAAFIGPWFLALVKPEYIVSGPVFGGLVLAGGAVGMLTLTGTAALAADHHLDYAAGWLLASAVGIAALWLPGSLGQRVVTALLLGPALGAALHLLLLIIRRPAAPGPDPTVRTAS